jgi:hypothetical protein
MTQMSSAFIPSIALRVVLSAATPLKPVGEPKYGLHRRQRQLDNESQSFRRTLGPLAHIHLARCLPLSASRWYATEYLLRARH